MYSSYAFEGNDKSFRLLVNFPDKEQTYQVNGDNLWPFFMSRIPGESRLKKDGKDKMDLVSLLKFYGKRTIANPYTLSST